MQKNLLANGVTLLSVQSDIIDEIWTNERPEMPKSMLHEVEKYSGKHNLAI